MTDRTLHSVAFPNCEYAYLVAGAEWCTPVTSSTSTSSILEILAILSAGARFEGSAPRDLMAFFSERIRVRSLQLPFQQSLFAGTLLVRKCWPRCIISASFRLHEALMLSALAAHTKQISGASSLELGALS